MQPSLGMDIGSVSVKLVLLDAAGTVMESIYQRHRGRPLEAAWPLLEALLQRHGPLAAACTGASGKHAARRLGVPHVNELSALAKGVARLHPGVRSVMEMGGEDAKLLLLEDGGVADFALNSVCAAGTGSFLDQQAERMRLSIEEFAALALKSEHPPRIAGRCSVFAKSDMIHLQQIATPLQDIVAGLCFAVARNFQGSIVRNRTLPLQVAFCGGVALNRGVVWAFREIFGLGEDELLVPQAPELAAAHGAALQALSGVRDAQAPLLDASRLARASGRERAGVPVSPHGVLAAAGDGFHSRHPDRCGQEQGGGAAAAAPAGYLGVDIGSISTCLAVVDPEGMLLCKRYLRTASQPIEAVRQGLEEIRRELGEIAFKGVGATGSGRYMIADLIGADLVKNEITAQARGAVSLDARDKGRGVDTVLEIGGQDSKYIQLEDGIIVDFEMNKACAAGTGSFLEEQAEKLSVSVKGEFAGLALDAEAPCALGERCTVFMENSLMSALQGGAGKDDLLAGLAYSIVENYINRVVAGRPVGERVFFQGGTACNKAVVAAFEKYLGREITVPEHNDVSGAIGMALLAREHMLQTGAATSAFKGFEVVRRPYELSSFTCKGCDNLCEINRVRFAGEQHFLHYGGRCEKYDVRRGGGRELPDLFAWRQQALEREHARRREAFAAAGRPARRGVMGLPRVFNIFDFLPWHATLLWELGFEVRLSPPTDGRITRLGGQATLADTCFPVKAALGHVRSLLEAGVTRCYIPSFVDLAAPGAPEGAALACPLTQSFPYQARQAFPEATVLAPPLHLKEGRGAVFRQLFKVFAPLGVAPWQLWRAMQRADAAQRDFEQGMRAKGREVLERLDELGPRHVLAVIGRGYNAMDAGLNLGVPRKLASLDTLAIPMDMLELPSLAADWPEMYWRSGQRMLAAARVVRSHPRLQALVIGSFSCGPDSFILEYLRTEMGEEPFLHIEIDEHSADAGVVTRCEAFLDSIEMRKRVKRPAQGAVAATPLRHGVRHGQRKVYIPRMGDQAFGLKAAFEACGLEAEVMAPTDREAMSLARRYVSGKECYPFAVTTADMLRTATSPGFEPGKSAFFMPSGSGPCRFGQYNLLQKMILERAGFPETPIISPMQDSAMYSEAGDIGGEFDRISWKGIVTFDLLQKCLHAARPFESAKGAADALYQEALEELPRHLAGSMDRLADALGDYAGRFAELRRPQAADESRPRVGIVGEIFVRTNTFSNEDLVRTVEELGGEAWLATVDEWVYYVNWSAGRNALKRRELRELARVVLRDRVQRRMAHKLEASLNGFVHGREPSSAELLRKASPWLHHSFRGEAVLSVGKAVDMLERPGHGVQGIILAMPFGCMPGTVAASLLRGVCQRYDAPMIALPFDGTASGAMRLQLETFMEQAVQRLRRQARP